MREAGCDRELLRDYAFDELSGAARVEAERHVAACAECAAELAQMELTTAALKALPEREIPQRIAFVSDRVFEPSPVARWFGGFWNSAARLGFASACVLAIALIFSVSHRPAGTRTIVKTVVPAEFSRDVDARIDRAVSDAVARVHEEDARVMKTAVEAADKKSERQKREMMVAMSESMNTLQKRLGVLTEYAMAGPERNGSGSGQ